VGGRYQVSRTLDLPAPYSRLQINASALPIHTIAGLRVDGERVNLAKLATFLPASEPLAGELSLHARAEGPWTGLRGEGRLDVRGLVVRGESLGDVALVLEGTSTQVALGRLLAGVGGGPILAHGLVTFPRLLVDLTLTWQGVHLDRLNSLRGIILPLSGSLNGTAEVRGAC
jgi:hypothetical protein